MKKKWMIVAMAVFICAGVAAIAMLFLFDPLADENQVKFDLIKIGMTKQEAEAVFGSEGVRNDVLDSGGKRLESRDWDDFSVVYDERNVVIMKFQRNADRTVLEKLGRRIGFRF